MMGKLWKADAGFAGTKSIAKSEKSSAAPQSAG